jgi:hypothetical protein
MLACLICFKISPGKLKPVNQMFTGFLIFRLDDFNLNQAVKDELLFHSSKGVAVYKVVLFDFKVQRTENIYSHFYYQEIQGAEHRTIDSSFKINLKIGRCAAP